MPTRRPKPKPNGRVVSAREAQGVEIKKSLERAVRLERRIQQHTRTLRNLVSRSDEQLEELGVTLAKRGESIAAGVASAEGRSGETLLEAAERRMCEAENCPAFAVDADGLCAVHKKYVTRESSVTEPIHVRCPEKQPRARRKAGGDKPLLSDAILKAGALVVVAVLSAAPARAEDQPAAWPSRQALADSLSTSFTALQLAADVAHAWRQPDRRAAVTCAALRIGLTVGLAEVTKRTVHRDRPDGSDDRSFFSEHTALATVAGGWSVSASLPIAFGAGYGRAAANKHYWSDILAGAAVGLLARRVCDQKGV